MTDNRTTELQKKLKEAGVKYTHRTQGCKTYTNWGEPMVNGAQFIDGGDWTELTVENATPEQAIAATMGTGAKPCPWCGREMQEGHHDGHVWYRDDSDYIASLKRSIDAFQKAHATLDGGNLTVEQVREAIERHFGKVAVLDDGKPVEWRDDWVCKVAIDYRGIADELNATLGSGMCELVETDSYSDANEVIHVLECSECGKTCEHVNGSYPRCPNCGKAVKR